MKGIENMFGMRSALISDSKFNEKYNGLYDYQKEAVDNTMRNIFAAENHYFGKIILPTGAGKTKIAEYLTAKMMNEVYRGYGRPSVCGIACHRLILANNLLCRIIETMTADFDQDNFTVIVVNSGEYNTFKTDFDKKFNKKINVEYIKDYDAAGINDYVNYLLQNNQHVFFVMLYHSLDKIINTNLKFDFVFCDEAHTTVEPQFYSNLEKFVKQSEIVIHMTATPTVNNTGKDMNNEDIYGDIIIEKQPKELAISKHICPIELILLDMLDNENNNVTRHDLFTETSWVIKSIMRGANSCFKHVEDNQINAGVSFENMKQGVFFVTVSGNKHLTEILHPTTAIGRKFMSWRENNDIDLYIISSEKGGCIDYPETHGIEENDLSKEVFLKKLQGINKERHNKSIIINIDMLSEGVDLPDINAAMILRQWDENTAKILQFIGRAVRRDDQDRKLITDNSVKYNEYQKFVKPCAYVYIPTAVFTDNECENLMSIMLKLYDNYGDIVFSCAKREVNEGDSIKLIENPSELSKKESSEHKQINFNIDTIKARETIIKLLSNLNVSYDDKVKFVNDWLTKKYAKNSWTEADLTAMNTLHGNGRDSGNFNALYDYIQVNYY